MREKEKERGKVSGFRVISPSQHRPLNSTPLVETESDTRKAKLLQMHKPFYSPFLSTLSRLYRCFPLHLLTPSSLRGVCNPPSVLFVFRRLFRLLLLSATHLYSVNPFHCENVVLQFTFPLLLPLFLLILPSLFLSIFSVFLLSFSLHFPSFYVSFKDVPLSRSFFLPSSTSEKPPAPDFFSITLFPIESRPSHALSRKATARLPTI